MLQAVLNAVLVCHHRRTTFPVTPGRGAAAALPATYIACLDCGKELPYDWSRMRVIPPAGVRPHRATPVAPPKPPVEPPPPLRQPPPRQPTPVAARTSSYLVRAKLRTEQVQVALRVLNALMTNLPPQPGDVTKLMSWTGPSHQTCSTRDLAQRVVACALSP
jgi:hypothetical protein